MIEQLSVQTRFKHPCKRSSNGLATHTPYNPRGRLKTPEASERPSGHCADAEVGREFHLSARLAPGGSVGAGRPPGVGMET
jgi:hypothetical protein